MTRIEKETIIRALEQHANPNLISNRMQGSAGNQTLLLRQAVRRMWLSVW